MTYTVNTTKGTIEFHKEDGNVEVISPFEWYDEYFKKFEKWATEPVKVPDFGKGRVSGYRHWETTYTIDGSTVTESGGEAYDPETATWKETYHSTSNSKQVKQDNEQEQINRSR